MYDQGRTGCEPSSHFDALGLGLYLDNPRQRPSSRRHAVDNPLFEASRCR